MHLDCQPHRGVGDDPLREGDKVRVGAQGLKALKGGVVGDVQTVPRAGDGVDLALLGAEVGDVRLMDKRERSIPVLSGRNHTGRDHQPPPPTHTPAHSKKDSK